MAETKKILSTFDDNQLRARQTALQKTLDHRPLNAAWESEYDPHAMTLNAVGPNGEGPPNYGMSGETPDQPNMIANNVLCQTFLGGWLGYIPTITGGPCGSMDDVNTRADKWVRDRAAVRLILNKVVYDLPTDEMKRPFNPDMAIIYPINLPDDLQPGPFPRMPDEALGLSSTCGGQSDGKRALGVMHQIFSYLTPFGVGIPDYGRCDPYWGYLAAIEGHKNHVRDMIAKVKERGGTVLEGFDE